MKSLSLLMRRLPRYLCTILMVLPLALMAETVTYHVATAANGGSDSGSGAANEPFLTLAYAVASADSAIADGATAATISVGAGNFAVADELILENPITLVGSGVAQTSITPATTTKRTLRINHAAAAVSNLTVSSSRYNVHYSNREKSTPGIDASGHLYGMAVLVGEAGGTLANCRVTDNLANQYFVHGAVAVMGPAGVVSDCRIDGNSVHYRENAEYGGGLYMTDGVAQRCLIDGNMANRGSGIYLTGGRVESSLIIGNMLVNKRGAVPDSDGGAGVWMSGGTLLNCTVTENSALSYNGIGGVYLSMGSPKLINTIVRGNYAYNNIEAGAPDIHYSNASKAAAAIFNSALPLAIGTATVTNAPCFVNPQAGDYRLTALSPCIDAGMVPDTGFHAATDYSGDTSRAVGLPDIGCHEFAHDTEFAVAIAANQTTPFAGTAFTLTPRLLASRAGGAFEYAWSIVQDDEVVATSSDEEFTTTLATPGRYTVTLSVTDTINGGTATVSGSDALYLAPRTNYVATPPPVGSAFPYATPETAAGSLADAYAAAVDGAVILLADGTYTLSRTLGIDKAVRIEGAAWERCIITVAANAPDEESRVMIIGHPDAEVTGVTLTGGKVKVYSNLRNSGCGCGVMIGKPGGTVSWSRITNNRNGSHYATGGGVAILGANGLVTHSIIDHNYNYQDASGNSNGGGAYVAAGVLENSLLFGNTAQRGGGLAIAGSGIVRGCTVAANTGLVAAAGVVWFGGSEVRNTIFAGNKSSLSDALIGKPEWGPREANAANYKAMTNAFAHCAFYLCEPLGSEAVLDFTMPFVDYAGGDFHLAALSRAIDAALPYADMPLVDLDGKPRLSGTAPDIGCYEVELSDFDAVFSADKEQAFPNEEITLTPRVLAQPEGAVLTYSWVISKAGTTVTNSTEEVFTFSLPDFGYHSVTLGLTNSLDQRGIEIVLQDYLLILPKTNYVSSVPLPDSASPYGTPETAATSLLDALAVATDGSVIILSEGEHYIPTTAYINRAIKVVGSGWQSCTLRVDSNAAGDNSRALVIDNAAAEVSGITITGAKYKIRLEGTPVPQPGYAVWIGARGGTLSWSRITGNVAGNHYQRGAVGITGSSGLVTHCIIDGNTNNIDNTGTSLGGGAYVAAGRLANSLVHHNEAQFGGGVALSGSGRIENCTVVANTAVERNGGVAWLDGVDVRVYNTIFVGNSAPITDVSRGWPEWGPHSISAASYSTMSNLFFNCAFMSSSYTIGNGAIFEREWAFVDFAGGDYRLRANAVGIDAGYLYDNMAAYDLDGQPRQSGGGAPDIGCYEYDITGFGCSFVAEATELFSDEVVVMNATLQEADPDALYDYAWVLTDQFDNQIIGSGNSFAQTIPTGRYSVHLTVTERENPGQMAEFESRDFLLVVPRVVYLVAGENLASKYPHASWESAATNFTEVLPQLIVGSTLLLGEGEHLTDKTLEVNQAYTIRGPGYKRATIRLAGSNPNSRVMLLAHPGALVEGITITGGRPSLAGSNFGGGVWIVRGGTLAGCRITDNRANIFYIRGGGVAVTDPAGRVTRCIVDNNSVIHREVTDNQYGGGIYASAGLVDNCLVYANSANRGGGIAVAGNAIFRNCTVVNNSAPDSALQGKAGYGGGVSFQGSGRVENTIFYGNTCSAALSGTASPEWHRLDGNGPFCHHCAFPPGTPQDGYIGTSSLRVDPLFKSSSNFRLRSNSPCHAAGLIDGWLGAASATDLDGVPRTHNGKVDIGCYQSPPNGTLLLVR